MRCGLKKTNILVNRALIEMAFFSHPTLCPPLFFSSMGKKISEKASTKKDESSNP
jgi:hypothetical protein